MAYNGTSLSGLVRRCKASGTTVSITQCGSSSLTDFYPTCYLCTSGSDDI